MGAAPLKGKGGKVPIQKARDRGLPGPARRNFSRSRVTKFPVFYCTLKRYTVTLRKVFPGRKIELGKLFWFGESG